MINLHMSGGGLRCDHDHLKSTPRDRSNRYPRTSTQADLLPDTDRRVIARAAVASPLGGRPARAAHIPRSPHCGFEAALALLYEVKNVLLIRSITV